MFLSTVGGFILLIAGLEMALASEGAGVSTMYCITAVQIIVVCGLAAALIAAPGVRVLALPLTLLKTMWPSRYRPGNAAALIDTCVTLADQVQRSGPEALATAPTKADPFLQRGLALLQSGADGKTVSELLYTEIAAMERRHEETYQLVSQLGRVAAGAGTVGSIMGIIMTLGHLEDTSKLGPAIATALISVFYGNILSALVLAPLGTKLKLRSQQEAALKRMLVDGLAAILRSESPTLVRERMSAGFSERQRTRISRRLSSTLAG